MRSIWRGLLAALLVLVGTGVTEAKFCGDDIGGARVACACGDVVASDTVLQVGDPVVSQRCELDGLIVRADPAAESITLNLNGLSLVGRLRGVGIKVTRGGSDGAVVVGGYAPRLGEVVGFAYGLTSMSPNALARLERVVAKANRNEGFMIRQAGAIVQEIAAEKNGAGGMRLLGSGGRFLGLRADENKNAGIAVNSPGAIVSGSANANGTNGIVAAAPRAALVDIATHGNRGSGVAVRRRSQTLENVDSSGNTRAQVRLPKRAETARRLP
jgi:hypothetical protein